MHCGKGHRFSPNQSSLSHNFSYKDIKNGMLGLGMAPKEILSRLFNPFDLKVLDLYLEKRHWDVQKRSPSRGSGYMGLREIIQFW